MRHVLLLSVLLALSSIAIAAPNSGASGLRRIPLDSLGSRCVEFGRVKVGPGDTDASECAVLDFGIIGKKANQTYYYALYCLTPNSPSPEENCAQRRQSSDYYRTDGVAIFVQDGQKPDLRLLVERASIEIGLHNYGRPAIVTGTHGEFLIVPVQLTGTGGGNASEYFFWDGRAWQALDTQAWLVDLRQRLPKGLELRTGVWPDLRRMSAVAGLYRHGDANCCPTGGTALMDVALLNRQLALTTVRFVKERIDPGVEDSAFRRNKVEAEAIPPAEPTPPLASYPSLQQPLTISSWAGNGFGVVGELTGHYRLEGNVLTIQAETLKLRQALPCTQRCVTIKSVSVELYGASGAQSFHDTARSAPLPVGKTFDGATPMVLGNQAFQLTLPAHLDLTQLWLGLSIENADGGTYYAHTERNLFARALHAGGLADDPCANVESIEQAIRTRCHQVLEQKLDHWYWPLVDGWNRLTHGPQPAFAALDENNLEAIRLLGAHGTDMDAPYSGNTPLMIAAANGNVGVVQALLKAGANVNYAVTLDNPQRGRTALNSALLSGSAETIKALLSAGAATHKPDRHGWLPVHYAAYYDSPTSLTLLKEHRANLEANTTTERSETPLMLAAQYGKLAALRSLLAQGVNTATRDRYGKNAYDYAVFFKQAAATELLRSR